MTKRRVKKMMPEFNKPAFRQVPPGPKNARKRSFFGKTGEEIPVRKKQRSKRKRKKRK